MDKSEELRDQVRGWFGSGTAKRNGESKVNAFCEQAGISRRSYHRKINAETAELDYEFLTQAAEFMAEWKKLKFKERAQKRTHFEARAKHALAI